jgi:hypothetical protein
MSLSNILIMGNILFNAVEVPVTTSTNINGGSWYCNFFPTDDVIDINTQGFCAKAWTVSGKLYAAVAVVDSGDNGVLVYKGNSAKTKSLILEPDEFFVISQVGPIKATTGQPVVVSDKTSMAGAFFADQFMFFDKIVYYFAPDGAGYKCTVGVKGDAGVIDFDPVELTGITIV